jgi:hypothetical protein
MAPARDVDAAARDVRPPRFDHGSDLEVVLRDDGSLEFHGDGAGEYVRSDAAIPAVDAH